MKKIGKRQEKGSLYLGTGYSSYIMNLSKHPFMPRRPWYANPMKAMEHAFEEAYTKRNSMVVLEFLEPNLNHFKKQKDQTGNVIFTFDPPRDLYKGVEDAGMNVMVYHEDGLPGFFANNQETFKEYEKILNEETFILYLANYFKKLGRSDN